MRHKDDSKRTIFLWKASKYQCKLSQRWTKDSGDFAGTAKITTALQSARDLYPRASKYAFWWDV